MPQWWLQTSTRLRRLRSRFRVGIFYIQCHRRAGHVVRRLCAGHAVRRLAVFGHERHHAGLRPPLHDVARGWCNVKRTAPLADQCTKSTRRCSVASMGVEFQACIMRGQGFHSSIGKLCACRGGVHIRPPAAAVYLYAPIRSTALQPCAAACSAEAHRSRRLQRGRRTRKPLRRLPWMGQRAP